MMQPPKPPPVIRAPSAPPAPGRLHGEVHGRHGDLEVVPHRGVGGVQQRAQLGDPARAQQVGRRQHPAVLGHHVPDPAAHHLVRQPAERGVEVGHVAQRRHPEQPGGVLAAGPAGGVLAVDQGVRGPGVQHQQLQPGGGAGRARTGSSAWLRQSKNRAWPAVLRVEAAWSISPVGAPTNSFSARRASLARSSGAISSPSRSTSAVSTAHSSAAEEDRPAPTGTSEVSTRSAPPTRCPASLQGPDHAGDVRRTSPAGPGTRSSARRSRCPRGSAR